MQKLSIIWYSFVIPVIILQEDESVVNDLGYDGDLLKEHEISEASHIISPGDQSNPSIPKGSKKITIDWLWDSIKLQKQLPTKMYKPD
ncbi:BRCT domain-containing protein [Caerostris darwini]|uniref:BRCT domain-containing protein n=1 Tax=Caerostris darwini TaxID=1538125 RepID=A0AAV4SMT0_9ARAC|nr:BRCT domain-containing protein [Caerostris darwini]